MIDAREIFCMRNLQIVTLELWLGLYLKNIPQEQAHRGLFSSDGCTRFFYFPYGKMIRTGLAVSPRWAWSPVTTGNRVNLTSTCSWTCGCGALGYLQATVKDPQNNQRVESAFHFRYQSKYFCTDACLAHHPSRRVFLSGLLNGASVSLGPHRVYASKRHKWIWTPIFHTLPPPPCPSHVSFWNILANFVFICQ